MTFYVDETGVVRGDDLGGKKIEDRKTGEALPKVETLK